MRTNSRTSTTIARAMPDEGMHTFPDVVEACVQLQRGNAAEAWAILQQLDVVEENDLGAADEAGAIGLAHLQLGDTARAIAALEGPYAAADDDGPRLGVGCRLALAYAVAQRADDARAVIDDLNRRGGGTYSDRVIALWAESLVHAQTGGDARASVDAAHAITIATDARVDQAMAALARACVLDALGDAEADAAGRDANRQLTALELRGEGWRRVFHLALDGLTAAESR